MSGSGRLEPTGCGARGAEAAAAAPLAVVSALAGKRSFKVSDMTSLKDDFLNK